MKRFFLPLFLIIFSFSLLFLGMGIGQLQNNQQKNVFAIPSPTTSSSVSPRLSNTNGLELAVVDKVIDGDTIELSDGRRVRYIGVDTPETVDPRQQVGCFGKEASKKNKELVLGKTVFLEKDVSETDRYGRLLRYVYLQVDDTLEMVNEVLVQEGFAVSSSYPPDIKYQTLFQSAETTARNGAHGLWGSCQASNDTAQPSDIANPSRGTDCQIKGNISTNGEKIYHLPGCGSYDKTAINENTGERWFCTEQDAQSAGWRKAKNC